MDLILSPKDNINKIELHDVETYCQEGNCLLVIFKDGRARSFPMVHLWYWQSMVPSGAARSKPPEPEEEKTLIRWNWLDTLPVDWAKRYSKPVASFKYEPKHPMPKVNFAALKNDEAKK